MGQPLSRTELKDGMNMIAVKTENHRGGPFCKKVLPGPLPKNSIIKRLHLVLHRIEFVGAHDPKIRNKLISLGRISRTSISVIIVNRNTVALLTGASRTFTRLICLSLPKSSSWITVSIDNSVKRVREAYPEVIVIEAGRNLGFAAANNRAFEKASGRFMLLVNTDAMLEKDARASCSS